MDSRQAADSYVIGREIALKDRVAFHRGNVVRVRREHTRLIVELLRKLDTLVRQPPASQAAISGIYVLAFAVGVGMRLVTLPVLARWLGIRLGVERESEASSRDASLELSPSERRAVNAVEAVFRNYPFGARTCLRRSLVLGRLLRHRRPVLRLGAARSGGSLAAHAWVEVDGIPILDVAPEERFAPLESAPRPMAQ